MYYWMLLSSLFCSVLCLLCFVRVCLYVLCGHLLGKGWPLDSRLWCLLWVCHFPIGILGQVWYLIVSIPDLCNLITFKYTYTRPLSSLLCYWRCLDMCPLYGRHKSFKHLILKKKCNSWNTIASFSNFCLIFRHLPPWVAHLNTCNVLNRAACLTYWLSSHIERSKL